MKLISSPHSIGTKPREIGGKEYTARLRHATYYCDLLKALDELYLKGGENIIASLHGFDAEWSQVQAGKFWANKNKTALN